MSLDNDIALLQRIPTLRLLGDDALRILAIGAENRVIEEREVLFHAGEPADAGYMIQQGSFSLTPLNADRSKAIRVGSGTLLGEFALLSETIRPATATALTQSSLIRITRKLFYKVLDSYPDAARKLRDSVAQRTDQMTREMANLRTTLGPSNILG
ncbi:MAG: Crp/Fnr family transcriptional regulator [Xanthobacteraceae bacterium]